MARFATLDVSATLHSWQDTAVSHILDHCTSSNSSQRPNYLTAAPTGTGKSFIGLRALSRLKGQALFVTPKVEIVADMLRKAGISISDRNVPTIGFHHGITTPLTLRNMMIRGEYNPSDVKYCLLDEAHHDEADTWQQIRQCLDENVRYAGLTATPFRGTPKSTHSFLETWGEPYWAITYPDAVKRGFLSFPHCETVPLVDDDLIEVSSTGEFVISKLVAKVNSQLAAAIDTTLTRGWWNPDGSPTRATIIGVPSSLCFPEMVQIAKERNIVLEFVDQSTLSYMRQRIFRDVSDRKCALVHINVVSEGVDLPIRRYLDLSSCMSPVLFLQRFGRCTRPSHDGEPQYLCTNRNLERHGYLLDGCLPLASVQQSQLAFDKPTERSKLRVFGLQTLGRLQSYNIRLTSGVTIACYNVTQMQGHKKQEYFVLLHPSKAMPVWFSKASPKEGDTRLWGEWKKCEPPTDLSGFKSSPPGPLSERQVKWWQQSAERHGLDVDQKLDAKRFQILPVLCDAKVRLA